MADDNVWTLEMADDNVWTLEMTDDNVCTLEMADKYVWTLEMADDSAKNNSHKWYFHPQVSTLHTTTISSIVWTSVSIIWSILDFGLCTSLVATSPLG